MQERHTEWPKLERYSDIPLFNSKAVVQQTGIAAPTLRAWERRYKILLPERAHNDYRLYSERDIASLRWLRDRVDEGMSISQAIALFRHLQEEHNQRQHKNGPPESTSPSRMPLSTLPIGEHQPPVESDKQEEADEQMKAGPSPAALQHVLDVEERANNSLATYNMRFVQERLLAAFGRLDEAMASRLVASALAIYPIEQVCAELITPTLWEIGRLWEQRQTTVSIEHFASAFFHGLLTNLFHALPTNGTNPLVIACCAPGEVHELAALMLSLLLRRTGLHVAYLGQSIETAGLLQTIRQLSPALVCVSATLMSCLPALAALGQQVQELPLPRPAFVFGGQLFEQHPDLIAQVPGIYLDLNLQTIIAELKRMAFQQVEEISN
ncbi:MAG TPA: cobalamin-dependent protein [Ktedonobacteraceae bacterium]|nr:cobalamin-dependent protein [Ktedonobacteraceae bacterium]